MECAGSLALSKKDLVQQRRNAALAKVFEAFDEDGSGAVEAGELLALGKARRKLGQKGGEWSEAQNARLLKKMDTDGSGTIDCEEFCSYFAEALTHDEEAFNVTIESFMEVAQSISGEREEKAVGGSPTSKSARVEELALRWGSGPTTQQLKLAQRRNDRAASAKRYGSSSKRRGQDSASRGIDAYT